MKEPELVFCKTKKFNFFFNSFRFNTPKYDTNFIVFCTFVPDLSYL